MWSVDVIIYSCQSDISDITKCNHMFPLKYFHIFLKALAPLCDYEDYPIWTHSGLCTKSTLHEILEIALRTRA